MALGPTSARRLTRDEYVNTISDLFGQTTAAQATAVLDDQAPDGAFRNDITGRVVADQDVTGYENVAMAIPAAIPWAKLGAFSSCATATPACQNGLITQLGLLVYRRPLSDGEVANLAGLYAAAASDATPFQTRSRLVLGVMLQSPHFLYQIEKHNVAAGAQPAAPSAFELSTRLSMLLWKAGPDAKLLGAIAQGAIALPNDIGNKVTEMLADPRARRGVREFADDWLGVYADPARTPDPAMNLTASVLVDMRQETLRFVERLSFDDKVDLMQMFVDKKTELTPEHATLYGLNPTSATPTLYDLTGNPNRIGLLTQPAVLGVRAGPASASLVQRGLTIMKNILCEDVGAPPDNATVHLQTVDPTLPERDRFAVHEQFGTSCAGVVQHFPAPGALAAREAAMAADAQAEEVPRSMASRCMPPRARARSTPRGARHFSVTSCARPSRQSASCPPKTAWCASHSSARSPTEPSPSRWIRCLFCAV